MVGKDFFPTSIFKACIYVCKFYFTAESEFSKQQGGKVTSNRLMKKFGLLHTKTEKYLEDSGCTTQSLLVCVMDVKHVKCSMKSSTVKELKSASSVSDVFHVFKKRNLLSSLHYDVVKHIIINLCCECTDLQRMLDSYESSYREFIQAPVHESCTHYEGRFEVLDETESEDNVDLLIRADDGITSFTVILKLGTIIAEAFRCSQVVLNIRYIEFHPPHLTLVYGIPCSTVDSIFPLTLEEWNELRSHSISEIQCTEWHYMLDDKGSVSGI